ncbi:RNA methyltransferase [Terracidiphilus gabretensis]|uniref:RNA methyltransferase n=1 Tax=Terracidiphilus gabretensis TaxID=1577687 RepID=UPI00071B3758|nr:RNA methyltransferase [Terracidiphilus gabretensis]
MLTPAQRDRIRIVLVAPRNPLNIGAVARAMANFGFANLSVVSAHDPNWREARSAVGAPELLRNATSTESLAECIAPNTLILGTGSLHYRKPDQSIIQLPQLSPLIQQELDRNGRIAILFGSEKRGLSRDELSYCHALVEIPTDSRQPSMNLGQAAAVCLYELACIGTRTAAEPIQQPPATHLAADSANLDRLANLIEETMLAARYSPKSMHETNRHDLRVLLRRLNLAPLDSRRIFGLFRRILNRLNSRKGTQP